MLVSRLALHGLTGISFSRAFSRVQVPPAVATTRADAAAAEDDDPATSPDEPLIGPPKPIRYLRISEIVSDSVVDQVKRLKIPGVHLEQRSLREYPTGALAASR